MTAMQYILTCPYRCVLLPEYRLAVMVSARDVVLDDWGRRPASLIWTGVKFAPKQVTAACRGVPSGKMAPAFLLRSS